jgi:flagellar protein FlaI
MSKGTLIPEIAAWLWLSIEHKLPILVCGEMGSGKTSLINALCGFIRPDSRIGTIEDVPEFKLPLRPENWLRHFTRESLTSQAKPISQGELLKQMLRENIQYLVVNEIRSEDDVLPWINAISSGHGGITSFHANSFEGVLIRMNSLGIKETNLLALSGGIIFINKYGEKKNMVRRIREIGYVTQRNHEVSYEQVVTYDPKNDSYNVDVIKLINSTAGKIISSGLKEKSLEQAIAERVEYLAWLLERSKSDSSIEKPEGFLNEISKYYNNPKYFKEEIVQMDEGADRKQGLELSPRIKGIKKMEKQRPMIKGKRDVGKRVAPKAKQKRSKWKFW